MDSIIIRGAKTHNLKNIDLTLPRNKLIVMTGLSGSGKSSLAFDTLYAEGQRRYVESLSTYARQFLSMMEKPEVDQIEGLSPAISIEQKSTSHNPRSTVGTITEVHDYLRLLYARVGEPRCPQHGIALNAQTVSQMVDHIMALPQGSRLLLLAPIIKERKGEYVQLLRGLQTQGYVRVRIDEQIFEIDQLPELERNKKHTIEVVVDRIKVRPELNLRLAESLETALALSDGLVTVIFTDEKHSPLTFSSKYACPICNYSLAELEPRLFSFNNPRGACPQCDGLGNDQFFDPARVIHDPNFSIATGAVRGWDRRNFYYFSMLTSLAEHYKFDLHQPYKDLAEHIKNVILYGSGDEVIEFHYHSPRTGVYNRSHSFEGVVVNMERRYKETDSNVVREELAKYLSTRPCQACQGTRLCEAARHVFIEEHTLGQLARLSIEDIVRFFKQLKLSGQRAKIASSIKKEIIDRLTFLMNVGLDYLTLDRSAETLSGGEAQRIRLASQIGSGLVGVMYILDEPSIGLHQRDNARLLETLFHLRDLGNTVIVVEHDEEAICSADHIVDIGPGAGVHGGKIVAQGVLSDIMENTSSLTGQYLSGKKNIPIPKKRVPYQPDQVVILTGAQCNNLQDVDLHLPLGLMTCVTGVSGSGKSSLINDTLYPIAAIQINRSFRLTPGPHRSITGLEYLDKVINIDQSPIGRTPRSNPATYTGIFTPIRELFAATQESRSRGYKPGRFSFNVKGGRCEACQGDGLIKVEMHFLPDLYVVCDVCKGKRYNRETLEVTYKGKNIYQVLAMSVEEANEFFAAIPMLARKLQTLIDVGLSYIALGQNALTLSGGEAQRVKLSRELSKRDTGKTLYLLDEPTTGLHFHDVKQLLHVLLRLRDQGNTIVIIEHNLDVIKTADWIIDLGPEGGSKGGQIIANGPPEKIAKNPKSHTGRYLKPLLRKG